MTREETLQELITEMNRSAEAFAKQSGAISCETFSVFKKGDQAENIKKHFAELTYSPGYVLLFQYTAHGMAGIVNSILECYLLLDRSPALPYPLSHVIGCLGVLSPSLLTIPLITDAQTMRDAFAQQAAVFLDRQADIETLLTDSDKAEAVRLSFLEEVDALTDEKISELSPEDVWSLEFFYTLYTHRMVDTPYLQYMQGNIDKALVKLERMKYQSGYEKGLLSLLRKKGSACRAVPPSVEENLRLKYTKNGAPKNSARELCALFLSWIALTVLWAPFFLGIFFLFYYVEGRNAELVLGPMAQLPMIFLPTFLMAICTSYYTRNFAFRLLFKKAYQQTQRLDHIENGPGSDRLMKVFLTLILICGMFFTMLLVKWNVKLLPNGIVDNSSFFSLSETYYRYNEVEKVRYQPNRQISGETVDISSYVIVLKDGKEIDLYDFAIEETGYDEFLSLLRQKGIPIEK